MTTGPIADLTYRGYEGALESPRYRWWVIARMSIRLAFKKKSYWVLTVLSGLYPVLLMTIIFFMEQFAAAGPQGEQSLRQFLSRIIWKDQFLHAFSFGQMWFLFLALLLGAGAIANDNRANALLVYLSKPCDKTDYLFGKWMGIFIPLCLSMAIPMSFFWLYGALSYRTYGFLSNDPWTIVKIALLIPVVSAFYASLAVFFSSLFKQGRIAGVTFAAVYFLSNIFTQLMAFSWVMSQGFGPRRASEEMGQAANIIEKLYYSSVDGLSIGSAKAILGTDGSPIFGIPSPVRMVPAPNVFAIVLIIFVISAISVWLAWKRIRAVEVIGG